MSLSRLTPTDMICPNCCGHVHILAFAKVWIGLAVALENCSILEAGASAIVETYLPYPRQYLEGAEDHEMHT